MRRITFWMLGTLSALVLLFGYHTSTSSSLASGAQSALVAPSSAGAATSGNRSAAAGSGGGTSGGSSGGSGSGSGASVSSGTSTVTGAVASTEWGPVQLRLTLRGDRITKVTVLQYPNGNPRDYEINSYALPILVQETKQSQSAGIDMVSGATVTSTGYIQSLQSALDKVAG